MILLTEYKSIDILKKWFDTNNACILELAVKHRQKKFWGWIFPIFPCFWFCRPKPPCSPRRVCSGWWWGRRCRTTHCPNRRPSITCPHVSSTYTAIEGNNYAVVTWGTPIASDPDGDHVT